MEEKRAN